MTDIKTAIVTAGGSGLGAGAARALAKDGYKVAVLSPSENCEHVAREIGGIAVRGSNHSTEDLQAIVDAVMAKWGRADVLVNSSGHGPKGPVLDISDEDWSKAMDLYLMNVVRGARIVTPIMEKQEADQSLIFPPLLSSSRIPFSQHPVCSAPAFPASRSSLQMSTRAGTSV